MTTATEPRTAGEPIRSVCIWCGHDNSHRELESPKWRCGACFQVQLSPTVLRQHIEHHEEQVRRYRAALEKATQS